MRCYRNIVGLDTEYRFWEKVNFLEPVTHAENMRRGIVGQVNAERQRGITHCPKGHDYTPENTQARKTNNGRKCRQCSADYAAEWRKKNQEKSRAASAAYRARKRAEAGS